MLRRLKFDKNHIRAIIALYLSYKLLPMTFVTGPLVCPLGRRKRMVSLRESAFWLRENTNFCGTPHNKVHRKFINISSQCIFLVISRIMMQYTKELFVKRWQYDKQKHMDHKIVC